MMEHLQVQECRCCLSPGVHKDLNTSYVWLNKKEVYSEMLQECFNIVLSERASWAICEACIKQLRSASGFRQLVLQSEQELQRRADLLDDDRKPAVKLEPESDSDDCFLADTVSVKDIVKVEPAAGRTRRGEGGRGGTDTTGLPNIKSRNKISLSKDNDVKTKLTWSKNSQMKLKHRDNLTAVLTYSNALPFKNKSLLGYQCGYCDQTYPDPKDLRSHTDSTHSKQRLDYRTSVDFEYSVKLDVTDLKCTLCDEKLDNLTKLKEHLVRAHGKIIHSDVKDHLQQFKLKKGEVYDCAMCSATYETFKMLQQHMNQHYRNYSCNVCGAAFATRRSLNAHRKTHQEASVKCDYCDKVFGNKTKKHYHEKTAHLGTRSIANCPFCGEPFRSYYQRNQHLIKVHQSDTPYKCNVCDKVYALKSLLMYHIKKSHLMERNCQCAECGYRFFSKKALKAHMVKHTGERMFSCEVCHKAYARKYTLREHMRIHANDRRFKCGACSASFVQKCSLRGHLLASHGLTLAARDISAHQ